MHKIIIPLYVFLSLALLATLALPAAHRGASYEEALIGNWITIGAWVAALVGVIVFAFRGRSSWTALATSALVAFGAGIFATEAGYEAAHRLDEATSPRNAHSWRSLYAAAEATAADTTSLIGWVAVGLAVLSIVGLVVGRLVSNRRSTAATAALAF
ncbi:MAG: hypothetical protein R3F20_15780 [Planctomycetota bacterium]